MKKRIISILGLKGSFSWALRQMKKGHQVTRLSFKDTVQRYQSDKNGIIMLTMNTKFDNYVNWVCGALCFEYIEATDWCLAKDHPEISQSI